MKKIQLGCFFLVYFVFIFGLTIVSACEEYASLSVEIDKDRYYAGEIVDGSIAMNNYFNSTARVAINVTLYKEDKIIKISTYNPNIYPGVNQYAIKDILGTVIIPKNTSGVYSLKINAFYGNCAWFASDNFLVQYDDEDVCDNYGSIVADIEKESYFPRELLGGEIRIINNMTNSESVLGIIDLYKNNEKYIRKTKYITIKPGANIFDINNVFGSIEIQDEHVGDFIFVFSMIGDCTWTAKDDFSVIPIENKSGVKEDIVNKIISNNITKEEIKQEFKKLSSSEKKKVIKFLSKQIGNVTDLQQENVGGKEMYNIKTKTVVNFLGFIPIKTNVNILLDPENNTITGIKKPWWGFLAKTKLYKAKSSNTKLIFSEQHLEFEIKSQAITKVKILPQKTGLINLKVNSLEYATDVPLLENAKEYFEIESNKEVSDVVIQFKLLKQNKNPRFFRYSDGWNELKVNKVGEDLIYVYYEALSEGLSIFALDFDEPTLLSSEFSPIGRYSSRLWLGNYTPSEEYLDFIASRYNFNVMPGSGGKIEIIDELRNRSLDINLIHYTNPIFTNTAISYPEEYYSHSNISTNYNNRILSTQFGMYLMNISSLEWRDAIANSTKEIIDLYDYFGVMVDDCGPAIEYRIDFLPDDFVDADKWISEINATLAVIKNKIGGKIMVFNGIYHSPAQNSRELLEVADGAIKEGFIFHLASGEFLTEQYWKILLNWIIEDTQTKYHIANAKFTMNRTVTINERMFQFTSYLLIKNENIIYNLDDFALITGVDNSLVQYYPEMDINLGEPLETYLTVEEYFNSSFNLYEREYENGIVFVNPSTAQVTHNLDKNYLLAVPEGGGVVQDDGSYGGSLSFEEVSQITVPAQSGIIIMNIVEEPTSVCGNGICEEGETAESCAGDCEEMTFLSVQGDKIIDENGDEIMLRGLHYDAFYVISKPWYFADGQNKSALDQYNTDLASYFFNEEDISNFKELGANVVRLELRLWEIEKEPYVYSEEVLNHLDNTIEKFGKNGIYVILDLHAAGQNILTHNNEYGNLIWFNESFSDRVVALWGVLAERYSENSYIAGYDIINEPQAPNKTSLHDFYQECIDKIREYDNNHILFLEVNLYQKEEILIGGVYDDDNLAVSMHFYDPYLFTNQGLKENPGGQIYPGTYNNVYWDKDKINSEITKFLEFEELAGKPMFFGEFSANVIDGGNYALQWIEDIIDVLNSKGIHYTFFNYRFSFTPSFGYYQPSEELDNEIITLMYQLINNQLNYEDLTMEQKELFLTINYEHFPELTQILEEGFEYNLTTTLVCGNGICEEGETAESCAGDCLSPEELSFGIALGHEGFYQEFTKGDVPIIREAGATNFGIHLHWSDIEPTSDNYDWSIIDFYLDEIEAGDNAYIVVFTDGFCTDGLKVRGALLKDGCEDDYRDFIHDLAERAGGKIKYWQREIEPGLNTNWPIIEYEKYVDIQQMFYEEIKRVDSGAQVGALGISGIEFLNKHNEEYFVQYFFDNADSWYDYLDIHLYKDKYLISEGIEELKLMMKNEKPIIIKESGGPTAMEYESEFNEVLALASTIGGCTDAKCAADWADNNYNLIDEKIQICHKDSTQEQDEKRDRIQCRDMNQRFIMAFAEGAKTVFHWDLLTPLSGSFNIIFGKLALIDEFKTKRNNYYCYQRMNDKLSDLASVEKISLSDTSLYFYKITKSGLNEPIYILWHHDEGIDSYDDDTTLSISATIPVDLLGTVKITDVFGSSHTKLVSGGSLTLDVDNTPLYIEEAEGAVCGNTICEAGETAESCAGDCGSFIGIDPHAQQKDFANLYKFQEIGINIYGHEQFGWQGAQPTEQGSYDWTNYDAQIKEVEKIGGNGLIKVWSGSNWASSIKPLRGGDRALPSSPIKPEYIDDFENFIKALVERYDGNGVNDMPGLQYPHLFYQFEGEPDSFFLECKVGEETTWGGAHWCGTPNEFNELTKIFHNAVKASNPDAIVMSPSPMFSDIFTRNYPEETFNSIVNDRANYPNDYKRNIFVKTLFSEPENWDIVAIQCNDDYKHFVPWVRWVQEQAPNKDIWCADSSAGYVYNKHTHSHEEYENEDKIEQALRNANQTSIQELGFSNYDELLDWALAVQSKAVFKKAVVAASAGVKHIFFQWPLESADPIKGWVSVGLLEDNIPQSRYSDGTKRPAFWVLKQFNDKIGNFDSVIDLNPLPEGVDPINWTWKLKFTEDNKEIFVLWTDNNNGDIIDLSQYISTPNVKITHIVTELDENNNPIYPADEIVSANSIQIDETPVFVEETSEELETCSAQGGDICVADEYCPGTEISATDTDRCCLEDCSEPTCTICDSCGDGLFNLCDREECSSCVNDTCYFLERLFVDECNSCTDAVCEDYDDDETTCDDDVCGLGNCLWSGDECASQDKLDLDKDGVNDEIDCNDYNVSIGKCAGCAGCSIDADGLGRGICLAGKCNDLTCPPLGICNAIGETINCDSGEIGVFPNSVESDCNFINYSVGICEPKLCNPICEEESKCLLDDDDDGIPNAQDYCNNSYGEVNMYGFPVPIMDKFDDEENTNLTYEDLMDIENFTIGKKDIGRIKFKEKVKLIKNDSGVCEQIDFDNVINISEGKVEIKTENLTELNQSAVITMFNITLVNPYILRDGERCSECEILSYENQTLMFAVTHFTIYEVQEDFYCGDGNCNEGESCSNCVSDCGSCPSPGGGGGGGSRDDSDSEQEIKESEENLSWDDLDVSIDEKEIAIEDEEQRFLMGIISKSKKEIKYVLGFLIIICGIIGAVLLVRKLKARTDEDFKEIFN